MADRYWVGGAAAWDGLSGTKWATTSGGAGGAAPPLASDDVYFDAASGAGPITLASGTGGRPCRSLNFTGFTGTFTHSAGITLDIGDGTAGAGNIALKLVAGMTYTLGNATTSGFNFISTSSTQQTIDTASKTVAFMTFNGIGGNWQLSSAVTTGSNAANVITLTAGTLDTNGQTLNLGGMSVSGTSARTLSLGASTVNTNSNGGISWNATTTTNFTFNVGTSTITANNPNGQFVGGGLTYNNVTINALGGGGTTMTGANTYANLTVISAVSGRLSLSASQTVTGQFNASSSSATNRGMINSSATGTAMTITAASVGSITNINFMDITAAGASAPWTATGNSGDAGGNTNITFPSPVTRYWVGVTGGSWDNTANWSTTSGGASGASIPLAHDTAIFDANSITSAGRTITVGSQCVPELDFTNLTNTPTVFVGITNGIIYIKGGFKTKSGLTHAATNTIRPSGRGSHTLAFNGGTVANNIEIFAPGGTYTMADAYNSSANFTLQFGSLDTNNFNVTCASFNSSNSNFRSLTMGSSSWNLTGTGLVWTTSSSTNLTLSSGTSTITISDTSSTAKSFSATSPGTINSLIIPGGGTGSVTIIGNFSMNNLTISGPKTILLSNTTTKTILTSFNVMGSAGNIISIASTVASSNTTLTKASGIVTCDYLTLQDVTATGGARWAAGYNSTFVSGVVGWIPRSGASMRSDFMKLFD